MTKENKELAKQADGEGGQPRGGKPKKFVDEVLLLSCQQNTTCLFLPVKSFSESSKAL